MLYVSQISRFDDFEEPFEGNVLRADEFLSLNYLSIRDTEKNIEFDFTLVHIKALLVRPLHQCSLGEVKQAICSSLGVDDIFGFFEVGEIGFIFSCTKAELDLCDYLDYVGFVDTSSYNITTTIDVYPLYAGVRGSDSNFLTFIVSYKPVTILRLITDYPDAINWVEDGFIIKFSDFELGHLYKCLIPVNKFRIKLSKYTMLKR